jgi:cystathionine beta-lyase/cystathionine gamma-synthase
MSSEQDQEYEFATRAIHAGQPDDEGTGSVTTPIHLHLKVAIARISSSPSTTSTVKLRGIWAPWMMTMRSPLVISR